VPDRTDHGEYGRPVEAEARSEEGSRAQSTVAARGRWLVLAVLVAVPFIAAAVAAFTVPWAPSGDEAIFLGRVLDARSDMPLVGVYSRYGWYHPGPLLTWWFALPLWVTGGEPVVGLVTAVALKVGSAVAIVVIAGRQAGAAAAALSVAVVGIVVTAQPHGPYAIWNPTIVLLTIVAFLLACWGAANGDPWAIPIALVAGSLATQAHVGYAPIVAAAPIGAVAAGVARSRWAMPPTSRAWSGPLRWPLITTGVLGVVVWSPVVWDQLFGSGNLGAIFEHFRTSDEARLGISEAFRVGARAYLPWGPWAGGAEPVTLLGQALGVSAWWLLVPAGALGAAGWSAWRRRDGVAGTLVVVAATTAAAGIVALGSTTGIAHPYLFTWSRGIGATVWLTVAVAIERALVAARPARELLVRRATIVLAVGIVAVTTVAAPASDRPRPPASEAVRALMPAAEQAAPEGSTVALTIDDVLGGVGDGLVYELERAGRVVTVPPDQAPFSYQDRAADPTEAAAWLLVAAGDGVVRIDGDPGWRRLALHDPLTAEERTEHDALRAGLGERLADAGGATWMVDLLRTRPDLFVDEPAVRGAELDRLVELHDRGLPHALYRRR
jgi:hypothetical protein